MDVKGLINDLQNYHSPDDEVNYIVVRESDGRVVALQTNENLKASQKMRKILKAFVCREKS